MSVAKTLARPIHLQVQAWVRGAFRRRPCVESSISSLSIQWAYLLMPYGDRALHNTSSSATRPRCLMILAADSTVIPVSAGAVCWPSKALHAAIPTITRIGGARLLRALLARSSLPVQRHPIDSASHCLPPLGVWPESQFNIILDGLANSLLPRARMRIFVVKGFYGSLCGIPTQHFLPDLGKISLSQLAVEVLVPPKTAEKAQESTRNPPSCSTI